MDVSSLSHRLPAIAALLQVPWFIVLSIARVRVGGTSARPLVKLVDLLMPLPTLIGFVVAVVILWQLGGRGGIWLWGGALACGCICAVFTWVLLN